MTSRISNNQNNPNLVFWVAIITLIIALSVGKCRAQDSTLLRQVNQLRGAKNHLTYNLKKQPQVDRYAASRKFAEQFIHSGEATEIIAGSLNGGDFIEAWLRSKKHRKIMLDKRYTSMASKVVKIRKGYYQAVIQFF